MTDLAPLDLSAAKLRNREIFIVIAALGAGGAERVAEWLAEHLLHAGARVTRGAFDDRSGSRGEAEERPWAGGEPAAGRALRPRSL